MHLGSAIGGLAGVFGASRVRAWYVDINAKGAAGGSNRKLLSSIAKF